MGFNLNKQSLEFSMILIVYLNFLILPRELKNHVGIANSYTQLHMSSILFKCHPLFFSAKYFEVKNGKGRPNSVKHSEVTNQIYGYLLQLCFLIPFCEWISSFLDVSKCVRYLQYEIFGKFASYTSIWFILTFSPLSISLMVESAQLAYPRADSTSPPRKVQCLQNEICKNTKIICKYNQN